MASAKHRYELIVKDVTWKEAEDGLYYFRYIGDEKEKLTREEWMNIYETETELKFDGSDMVEISK